MSGSVSVETHLCTCLLEHVRLSLVVRMAAGKSCKSKAAVPAQAAEYDPEELIPKRGITADIWRFLRHQMSDIDPMMMYRKSCREQVVTGSGNSSKKENVGTIKPL